MARRRLSPYQAKTLEAVARLTWAVRAGAPLPTLEAVTDAVWGEPDSRRVNGRLSVVLKALRALSVRRLVVESTVVPGPGPYWVIAAPEVLESTAARYRPPATLAGRD